MSCVPVEAAWRIPSYTIPNDPWPSSFRIVTSSRDTSHSSLTYAATHNTTPYTNNYCCWKQHHHHQQTVSHKINSVPYREYHIGTTVFRGTRNFEPSRRICPFPRNFYVLNCFQEILRNSVLSEFRAPYCMHTWFCHELHDWYSGSDRRNTEHIELSLSEILPVNWVDRLYLSVTCYRRQILHIWSG